MKSSSLLRYGLSAGLFLFLLMQMDMVQLWQAARGSNAWLLGIAIVFILGQIFFLNLRWHEYLNVGRHKIPFKTSVLINIAGYFANVLFLTSVGGIIAKSGLAIRHGVAVGYAVFATFLDRFMTLVALIVFSALGLPFLQETIDHNVSMMLVLSILFVVLSVALFAGFLWSGLFREFILSSRRRSRIVVMLRSFIGDSRLMLRTILYSLAAQSLFIVSIYVLSMGVSDHHARSIEFLALIPVLALISSLPISFGGWGIREGAFIYGLGLIGFSMEDAFFLSIQVGLVTLVAPFLVGLPYLLRDEFRGIFVPKASGPAKGA